MRPPADAATSTAYKRIILASMREVLAPRAFKKRASVFLRPSVDVHHLVSLQSSVSSTSSWCRVTVNLGVWSEALDGGGRPSILAAQWQRRLGASMPDPMDRWWAVGSTDEATRAATAIADAIVTYGVPELDAIPDLASLAALWKAGRGGLTPVQTQRYLAQLSSLQGPAKS